ncbi:MAG TPA: hypothetical protein VGR94_08665, partial [Candidatus Acidoferrales bacterium]|nr:hypothetical protein [Candidatus Acidoferrales bacterium]
MKKTLFLLVLLAIAVPLQAQEYAKAAPANSASAAPTRMMTQNPKTDTEEIRGKLGRNSGRGGEDDAQERSLRGADRSGIATSGSG